MFTGLKKRIIDFYTKEKEFDVRLFKLLGTAGVLVSILGAAFSNSQGRLINLIAALASVCLMWFVHATGQYLIGYLITTVVVFMGLFTWLFLVMGGINGAIPYFFAFGIVFTLLMYKGVLQLVMEIIQIAYYVLVCVFSYNHPELVKAFENPWDQFFGQIIGIVFSSVGIGLIFIRYIREYRKQQNIAEDSSKAGGRHLRVRKGTTPSRWLGTEKMSSEKTKQQHRHFASSFGGFKEEPTNQNVPARAQSGPELPNWEGKHRTAQGPAHLPGAGHRLAK